MAALTHRWPELRLSIHLFFISCTTFNYIQIWFPNQLPDKITLPMVSGWLSFIAVKAHRKIQGIHTCGGKGKPTHKGSVKQQKMDACLRFKGTQVQTTHYSHVAQYSTKHSWSLLDSGTAEVEPFQPMPNIPDSSSLPALTCSTVTDKKLLLAAWVNVTGCVNLCVNTLEQFSCHMTQYYKPDDTLGGCYFKDKWTVNTSTKCFVSGKLISEILILTELVSIWMRTECKETIFRTCKFFLKWNLTCQAVRAITGVSTYVINRIWKFLKTL